MATRLFSHSWTDVPAVDLQQRTSIKATLEPPGHLFARLASPRSLAQPSSLPSSSFSLLHPSTPLFPPILCLLSSSARSYLHLALSVGLVKALPSLLDVFSDQEAPPEELNLLLPLLCRGQLDTSFGSVPSKQQPQAEQQIVYKYVISAVPDLQHHPSYHL
ncbi:hypothetical protein HBI49_044530 [Parastagonospora nodorum]|nr:hypothetical protein HBI49_044530 [Parastagonospora nodorum]KAH6530059.1 hypothetical protein HBI07_171240 [Parastagonospora nodorum]